MGKEGLICLVVALKILTGLRVVQIDRLWLFVGSVGVLSFLLGRRDPRVLLKIAVGSQGLLVNGTVFAHTKDFSVLLVGPTFLKIVLGL